LGLASVGHSGNRAGVFSLTPVKAAARGYADADLYMMINAYWRPLTFRIQDGGPEAWRRVVDTFLPSPCDIVDPGLEPFVTEGYEVQPRSIVVLVR
jgi:pullulanase/glycogen debranching enzyme